MDKIKELNKCNNCEHSRICLYSESKQELLDTMNKQLVSWCGTDYFLPEFFEFSFDCKEFMLKQKEDMILCTKVTETSIPRCLNLVNETFCRQKICK